MFHYVALPYASTAALFYSRITQEIFVKVSFYNPIQFAPPCIIIFLQNHLLSKILLQLFFQRNKNHAKSYSFYFITAEPGRKLFTPFSFTKYSFSSTRWIVVEIEQVRFQHKLIRIQKTTIFKCWEFLINNRKSN